MITDSSFFMHLIEINCGASRSFFVSLCCSLLFDNLLIV